MRMIEHSPSNDDKVSFLVGYYSPGYSVKLLLASNDKFLFLIARTYPLLT